MFLYGLFVLDLRKQKSYFFKGVKCRRNNVGKEDELPEDVERYREYGFPNKIDDVSLIFLLSFS